MTDLLIGSILVCLASTAIVAVVCQAAAVALFLAIVAYAVTRVVDYFGLPGEIDDVCRGA
jgi:hypothetical protein